MGIAISDSTAVGYYFNGFIVDGHGAGAGHDGRVFVPDRRTHDFTFRYDPQAKGGSGQVTYSLDDESFTVEVRSEQRSNNATFDRFGLCNYRSGGNSVRVYFDDLSYTARREKDSVPTRHRQEVISVPYPKSGRRY